MRGSKYALWVAVISAALVTAGLSLSCGDDDGDTDVDCQAACEKLMMCGYYFVGNAADCTKACEQELAEAKGDLREDLAAAFQCIPDTDCLNIYGDCFCKPACQKLADCNLLYPSYESMAECVYECDDDWDLEDILVCFCGISSCQLIHECWD
jgi:hypothetical protein